MASSGKTRQLARRSAPELGARTKTARHTPINAAPSAALTPARRGSEGEPRASAQEAITGNSRSALHTSPSHQVQAAPASRGRGIRPDRPRLPTPASAPSVQAAMTIALKRNTPHSDPNICGYAPRRRSSQAPSSASAAAPSAWPSAAAAWGPSMPAPTMRKTSRSLSAAPSAMAGHRRSPSSVSAASEMPEGSQRVETIEGEIDISPLQRAAIT